MNKPTRSKSSYFNTILDLIENNSVTSIAKKMGIPKTTLHYYIKQLNDLKVIEKIGFGTWKINNDHLKEWQQNLYENTTRDTASTPTNIRTSLKPDTPRGHAFMLKLPIKNLKNWDRRTEYLTNNNIKFKPLHIFGGGQSILVEGHKVWLTNSSIIVYAPEFKDWFAETAKEAKSYALHDLILIFKRIETLLKVDLHIRNKAKFKLVKQHYGHIKNALAKQYHKEGKKLNCYLDGEQWLIIDNSKNYLELETTNAKTADEDSKIVVTDFFNSLKQNPITVDFILEGFAEMQKDTQDMKNNTRVYAENIKTHIGAIQQLGTGVTKLTDLLHNAPSVSPTEAIKSKALPSEKRARPVKQQGLTKKDLWIIKRYAKE